MYARRGLPGGTRVPARRIVTVTSIFSRILAGDIPGEIVRETDRVFVLRDIAPKAPVHLLVIPKTEQYANVVELAAGDPALLAEMAAVAGEVAGGDFRLVFNTGESAGQSVFHVHAHVLAGGLSEGSLGD
jgi:histidine triad (HIT) family protein